MEPGKVVSKIVLINDIGTAQESRTDVTAMSGGLNIYESIFLPCMSGFFHLIDTKNLKSVLPITSNTYVYVELIDNITSSKAVAYFKVYAITDIENESINEAHYNVKFISVEYINNKRLRINKTVKGNGPSVIKELHQMISKKKIEIADDAGRLNLILPNMNPYEGIRLILNNMNWRGGVPDYVYFETFFQHTCKSISEMNMQLPLHTIQSVQYKKPSEFSQFSEEDAIRINDMKSLQLFDEIVDIEEGLEGATVYTYDPITGQSVQTAMGINPGAHRLIFSNNTLSYTTLFRRRQLIKEIQRNYWYVSVPGLLARKSGDMCDVSVLGTGSMHEEDRNYSGRFMICGITHRIIDDNYSQNLTFSRYQI